MTVAEPQRTALMLIPLVDSLDEVDADPDALLRGHDLDRESIRDFSLRLPATTIWDLFREAEAMTADPTIGVRAGLSIRQGVFDVFDYAVGSAATLGDAWTAAIQIEGLISDPHKRSLHIEGERAVSEFHREPGEPDVFAEFAIASIGTFARQVTGQFLKALRVTFRRAVADGGDPVRFGALLGHAPEFGATVDSIEFPSSYLALPLQAANPALHRILDRHAQELLARLPKVQTLTGRVRELIVEELASGNPGLVRVAERLGTSARTLRRRLAEEDTTHQELLDGLRRSLADRYLDEETFTVGQVAVVLGFSNPSAFNRAFRRWNGTTPELYRRTRSRKTRHQ